MTIEPTQSARDAAELLKLDAAATPGVWEVDQFAGTLVMAGHRNVAATGGYQSNFGPDPRIENDANAAFITSLVNLYRAGRLTVADPTAIEATEQRGYERGLREAAGVVENCGDMCIQCHDTILAKLGNGGGDGR